MRNEIRMLDLNLNLYLRNESNTFAPATDLALNKFSTSSTSNSAVSNLVKQNVVPVPRQLFEWPCIIFCYQVWLPLGRQCALEELYRGITEYGHTHMVFCQYLLHINGSYPSLLLEKTLSCTNMAFTST